MSGIYLPIYSQYSKARWRGQLLRPMTPPVGAVTARDPGYGFPLYHAWDFLNFGDLGRNSIPSGRSGDVTGTPSEIKHEPGVGVLFDTSASTDRIDLGVVDGDDVLGMVGDATMIARVYVEPLNDRVNDFSRVFDKSSGANGTGGWCIFYEHTSNKFFLRTNGVSTDTLGVGGITADSWVNLAVKHVGGAMHVMAEGYTTGTDFSWSGANGTNIKASIGNWNHASGREWGDKIAYIHFFGGALTDAEIEHHWRNPYIHLQPHFRTSDKAGVIADFSVALNGGVQPGLPLGSGLIDIADLVPQVDPDVPPYYVPPPWDFTPGGTPGGGPEPDPCVIQTVTNNWEQGDECVRATVTEV